MILDPRRRFRDRLLIGMLAVALLPLVTFAVLAAIDLDAIGKSTAEAAQGAILQDEQARQQSTVNGDAALINAALTGIDTDLAQLGDAVSRELAQPGSAKLPVRLLSTGAACYTTGQDGSVAVLACKPPTDAARLVGAAASLVPQMELLRKDYPEVQAVWVANQDFTATRVVPPFNVPGAIKAGYLDPIDPQQNYHAGYFATSEARYKARGWTDAASIGAGGPYWTDQYPLLTSAPGTPTLGISAWLPIAGKRALVGVDLTVDGLIQQALSSATVVPLPPGSYPLLLSSDGQVLYAGRGLSFDFNLRTDPTGSLLPAPLLQQLKPELARGVSRAPLVATLSGTSKDVFMSPIGAGRWLLARPVPLSDLEPDLAGLTAGVTSGVHHLYPLVVLPALVLLLLLAFVVATVLSRRLVGPVRHLTVAAELLARGETRVPVPPQGKDEVGVLAAALERMRRDINASNDAILAAAAELEGRVALRTQELRARNDELVALNDLAGSLTRSLEPRWILGDALQAVRAIHPLHSARGFVLDGEQLSAVASWPALDEADRTGAELDAVAAEAVARKRPVRRRVSDGALIGWPLSTQQGIVGALAVHAVTVPGADTRRLLQAVADQVALALRTSLLSAAGREHAVLEERTRLAREIHDTLAQQLTGIVIQLEAAETLVERKSDRAATAVGTARDLARSALQEARRSVWNLRPAPLAATGLVAALEREVRSWESRSNISARFRARSVPPRPSLQPAAEVALLRTVQEALSNVARHSGSTRVDVRLRADGDEIVLSVHDNGHGFDAGAPAPRTDCFGLEGMRERVRLAGGTLTVMSSSSGTEITARLPLAEPATVAHTA